MYTRFYRLLGVVLYFPIRWSSPFVLRSAGYKRSKVGKCAIWAPPNKMQAMLEGVKFLQAIDPEMFGRLTAERRYVVWYDPKRSISCRDIFSVTDSFLSWGREGVATCLVQNVLDFTLLRLPFEKISGLEHENLIAARRETLQRLFK